MRSQAMKKVTQKSVSKEFKLKALAATLSALSSMLITSSVAQASDIDIYQVAKSGDVTLMFMLDISGSMSSGDTGVSGSRFQRVENAMKDLLQGNASKGIERISNDKIIGLATFDASAGHVRIPARRLDAVVGNSTQRQILIDFATNLPKNNSRTPTANAYADVAAYMFGTTTKDLTGSGFSSGSTTGNNKVRDSNNYVQPSSLQQTQEAKQCSGQGIYVLTDGEPNQSSTTIAGNLMKKALNVNNFSCNNSPLSEVNNPTYGQSGAWSCIGKFNERLLDPEQNPAKIKIKTAVVGFGSIFNGLPSYDKALTQEQNLNNINNAWINSTIANDIRNAARWGILGEGGWYSGNSSQDVVDSVNDFINSLATDIPSVATGSPVIPKDLLNPISLQSDIYYQQLTPTPDKGSQLWVGNMKKYKLNASGQIVDRVNGQLLDATGRLKDNLDFWSPAVSGTQAIKDADENTYGSLKYAQRGGAWSQLLLRDDTTSKSQRKLITNRTAARTTDTNLVALDKAALLTGSYRTDPARGHLLNLLGYNVSLNNITANSVTAAPELRQIGAVIHSEPVLITSKGKTTYNTRTKTYETLNREDYVLFGTTQGVLHLVDAKTGKEKFAFVPNEMIENQKEAFLKSDTTSGGMSKLYYGIDAPWNVYTEYVFDSSGNSTVGRGRGEEEGKQIAYGGLRMGGRSYYALNLQNINSPSLLFQISPAEQKVYFNGASKSFDQLRYMGQSWSKPTIAWVNWGGARKRVMFVGGGYDAGGVDGDARDGNGNKGLYAGYEVDTYNQTNKIGGGVYMFDADNGDLLWWASSNATSSSGATTNTGVIALRDDNLKYSVVSEIRTVDRDGDDLVDHLYFGDLGGQVFRIDINNAVAHRGSFAKSPRRILNLNNAEKSPRFYETPGFSLYNQNGTVFAAIAVGSGNRSSPLKDYTVGTAGYDYDAVYVIYDKDVARKDLYTTTSYNTSTLTKGNLIEIDDTNRFADTNIRASYGSTNGWYYRFKSNKLQSEKVYGMPLAMNNYLYVPTFDGSKPGLAGDCGAGVKGASFVTTFCMPFGQCPATDRFVNNNNKGKEEIGPGIHDITTGGTGGTGGGSSGTGGPNGGGGGGPLSSQNYCIDTGARQIVTVKGASENGTADSKICLIPQRWYERFK